ncbi:hypothetical protein H257_12544 [Aphanomyces astaci]|uniref:HTH CENPB-type domain-containing protein n=1 Tax=Aphanomyces astaci TaxID=112090 RepID=W4FY37_APHAT|nr:hypothetical protein H257_12544 [Aphanomyces astaci]ETV72407.1 hypothetical protein H257_12544 [Aphanomyces astaci]RQM23408.1 hypothetical protein B5M09_008334 [Aphanomyces astaci]|eukprot:XP_009838089.1 hypothetical protein H257_12544 [Aphanomyces astaci]
MLASKKHTRQALSLADKKRICEISQLLVKSTHQQVADEFNKTAERSVQRLMVTKTLREKDKWLAMDESQLGRKRMRGGKFEALEHALSLYLQEARAQGARLSDSLLTAHAERLRAEHNIKDSEFKISNGWVQNFKRRHSIRMHSAHHGGMHVNHGDPDDAKVGDLSFLKLASSIDTTDTPSSPSATPSHLSGIHQLIVDGGFKPSDVFHYDEHVLYYGTPASSLAKSMELAPSRHRPRRRMLLGLLTNVVGDWPMVSCVQDVVTSHVFADMLYAADFVDTHPHAHMTKAIFTKFILHINTVLAVQEPPRRILCFLDASPCHAISMEGHMSTICGMRTVELSHMLLAFLPPRVPPHLTPLGAGLTTYFHLQFKITLLKWLLSDTTSPSTSERRTMTVSQQQVQTMLWVAQLWKTIPPSIAKTSWRQSQWLPPSWVQAWEHDDVDGEVEPMAESLMAQAQSTYKELHALYHGASLKEDDEDHAPPPSPSSWAESPPDESEDAVVAPTVCQALDAAHQVLTFMEQHPVVFTHDDVATLLGVANRISGFDYQKDPPTQ